MAVTQGRGEERGLGNSGVILTPTLPLRHTDYQTIKGLSGLQIHPQHTDKVFSYRNHPPVCQCPVR
uniref:Uncharacterized protein n=1 Tax=Anguilla anguilla TaxID=7936 RepID=A0A0E9W8M4_ANGAN